MKDVPPTSKRKKERKNIRKTNKHELNKTTKTK